MNDAIALSFLETLVAPFTKVRERNPLVHNITNFVVMNSSANILLALGAAPVMAHAVEEVTEMVTLAGALVLNIGTLDEEWIDSMLAAGRKANDLDIPIILDPVGAGATAYRTRTSKRLLKELKVTVLRGNASEILSLSSAGAATRGVDSQNSTEEARAVCEGLAREHRTVVAVSGEVDIVTDGSRTIRVANGHPMMSRVTGLGCGLSAAVGAFCATHDDYLTASTSAFCTYGLAGEIAMTRAQGPGTFEAYFRDALYCMDQDTLRSGAKVSAN